MGSKALFGKTKILSVNSNYSSLFAANAARNTQNLMDKSVERLSTGMRINSAKDDAAGLAISMRLNAEIQGLAMASRNAADGQSFLATAEGALQETTSLLLRMKELAVQSANGTLQTADRTTLEVEFESLEAEINRIAKNTTWAGHKMLDGSWEGYNDVFHVGPGSGQRIRHIIPAMTTTAATIGTNLPPNTAAVSEVIFITDVTKANSAILQLDIAIAGVAKERGKLGSTSNRLDSTIANLDQIKVNLSASKGRIEDADFAVETGNLAKSQILQQAATAMLAQANASKSSILALVKL